jgi:hypothetical protein
LFDQLFFDELHPLGLFLSAELFASVLPLQELSTSPTDTTTVVMITWIGFISLSFG